jgi:hypothetical protein
MKQARHIFAPQLRYALQVAWPDTYGRGRFYDLEGLWFLAREQFLEVLATWSQGVPPILANANMYYLTKVVIPGGQQFKGILTRVAGPMWHFEDIGHPVWAVNALGAQGWCRFNPDHPEWHLYRHARSDGS